MGKNLKYSWEKKGTFFRIKYLERVSQEYFHNISFDLIWKGIWNTLKKGLIGFFRTYSCLSIILCKAVPLPPFLDLAVTAPNIPSDTSPIKLGTIDAQIRARKKAT